MFLLESIQKIIATCLLIFIAFFGYPQSEDMYFEHFSIDEGLSQNTVQSIFQDYKGYMWFGTMDGLDKYDGEKFTNYKYDSDNSKSVSSNDITCIFEDSNYQLWIGTENGLNRYNRELDCFDRFLYTEKDTNTIASNLIYSICQDADGIIWIATDLKINLFDPVLNKFTVIDIDTLTNYQSSANYASKAMFIDSKQNVWFGTFYYGLVKYNLKTKETILYKHKLTDSESLSSSQIMSIYEDSDGTIWVGTNNGLNRLDPATNKIDRFFCNMENIDIQSYNKINSIIEDKDKLWLATENSVINFDRKTYESYFIKNNPFESGSLSDNRTCDLLLDNIGSLWIGTWTRGVSLYNRSSRKFSHYKSNPYIEGGLSSNKIYSMEAGEDGEIWMGTYKGGLNCFNPQTKEIIVFKNDQNNTNSIIDDDVWEVEEIENGDLWLGTSTGISIFDIKREKIKHHQYDPYDRYTLPHNTIWAIEEDHSGNIWVGTLRGLARYNINDGRFYCYYFSSKSPLNITHNSINCITVDHLGVVWIGTPGGVNSYDRKNNRFNHLYRDTTENIGLNNEDVVVIFEDSKYNLWFGSYGGLNKYDRDTEKFTYYTEKNGLPNNVIYSIQEDNNGNLWISTNRGISRLDVEKEEFKNYDVSDGLQSNEFNNGSCKSKDGKMYFCGINGFNEFHPDSIKSNIYPPKILITGLKIFNEDFHAGKKINERVILPKDISETEELILSYKDRVVTFEFAALNFVCSEKNEYAYMMEGFETKWNYVGNRNIATYTNLPYGEYVFRVKASNNDNVWNEDGISLSIIVVPPFWETLLFKISLILLIVGVVLFIYQVRIRNMKAHKERLEMLVEERTKELLDANATKNKFFSIIAHDLKNSFYSLLGFSELLLKNSESYDQHEIKKFSLFINKASQNLFNLLENLLQWSKSQIGSIKYSPNRINLENIVKNTIILLEPNAEKKNIQLISKMESNFIINADFEMITTVMRNLMDNAIKFTTEDGIVEVSSFKMNDEVEVWVRDTGVGIDDKTIGKIFNVDVNTPNYGTNKEKGTGLGLILCKEFIEKHGGKIWVDSIPQRGSIFKFSLPTAS